jgi:dTMP kinase
MAEPTPGDGGGFESVPPPPPIDPALENVPLIPVPVVPEPEALEHPGKSPYAVVLRLRNFRRLWIAMTVSSIGDWMGLFALLSITDRLSHHNPLSIAGLMVSRVLPAFLVGPLAGVVLDRIDRRKAMIAADITRACLIAMVPFVQSVFTLYVITFFLEVATLVWMPAKDALIPNLVPKRLLLATNSLALFTTYGVFPLGGLAFTALVGVSVFLGAHVGAFHALHLNRENLALWIDTVTFLASATIVSRMRAPSVPREKRPVRLRVLWEELVEGLHYLRERSEVARIMRSIAVALAGGAVVFSLGDPFATSVLHGGPGVFGGIVAALGTGMGLGVFVLGLVGERFPKAWLAASGVMFAGVMLLGAAVTTHIVVALIVAALFGAGAGVAYASLFALLQEVVHDDVRGRVFSSVQVVIRVSLFVSLVLFPAAAAFFSKVVFHSHVGEGVQMAIAAGGLLTIVAGVLGALDVYRGRIGASVS